MGAQEGIDLPGIERNADLVRNGFADVHHALDRRAAAQLLHELAGAVDGRLSAGGVQALLENAGGIRAETDALGGFADVGAVEGGRLKENGLHLVGDLGILTAHDAGDADLLLRVADHEDVVVHLTHLAVQGLEHVAVLGPAHNDFVVRDGVQVKGVHGLALLDHDIVGDVDQVVDGADAARGQTPLHPVGGGADLDIRADTADVAAAQVGILHLDGDVVVDIALLILCGGHVGLHEGRAESDGRLAGDPEQAVAVHAVGCDLIFKNGVAQA